MCDQAFVDGIPLIKIRVVKAHTRGKIGYRIRKAMGKIYSVSADSFERMRVHDCQPMTVEIELFGCKTRLFEGEWEFLDPGTTSEMWE